MVYWRFFVSMSAWWVYGLSMGFVEGLRQWWHGIHEEWDDQEAWVMTRIFRVLGAVVFGVVQVIIGAMMGAIVGVIFGGLLTTTKPSRGPLPDLSDRR